MWSLAAKKKTYRLKKSGRLARNDNQAARVGDSFLAIKPSARKELEALGDALFTRIERKIMTLAKAPRPQACTKLKGHADIWRLRVGDYRVLYTIDDQQMIVRMAVLPIAGRCMKREAHINNEFRRRA